MFCWSWSVALQEIVNGSSHSRNSSWKIILFLIDFFVVVPVLSILGNFFNKIKMELWLSLSTDRFFDSTYSNDYLCFGSEISHWQKIQATQRLVVRCSCLQLLTSFDSSALVWPNQRSKIDRGGKIISWSQLELKGKIYKPPEALVAHGFSFAVIALAGVLSF